MTPERSRGIPQQPSPDEGHPPRSERDPREPTSTGPESVETSVDEAAEHVGKEGPDAADRPSAEGKEHPDHDLDIEAGKDLEPDEGADVLETRKESREIKEAREEKTQDEDVISLDGSD